MILWSLRLSDNKAHVHLPKYLESLDSYITFKNYNDKNTDIQKYTSSM